MHRLARLRPGWHSAPASSPLSGVFYLSSTQHRHDHATHGHGPAVQSSAGGTRETVAARRADDRRRMLGALLLTVGIAVLEAVGGWRTGSLALLSDAGHMLTDVSALVLALLALWFAGRPADLRRTYGYVRLEILSALMNGVLLLGITLLIVMEAISRLHAPPQVRLLPMAVIAAIGFCANLGALGFLHRSHTMNARAAFLHVLGDTLSSSGVLLGAGVMALTGWRWVDPALSLAISVVIVIGSWRLLRDAVDVLLEAVPAHVDLDSVRLLLQRAEGVVAVHDLHVWTLSSGLYALSAHLVVCDPAVCNNDEILSAVKHELLGRYGIDHTTIQIESETYAHAGEVH
jgi:cobalt-zinc-cadmium efflux system protein